MGSVEYDAGPSTSQRIETGWGRVYVHIVDDGDGDPVEVFVNTGQSGGLYHATAETVGKLASAALQRADDRRDAARELEDKLIGVRSDKVAEDNGDTIYSIQDAVGVALRRHRLGACGQPVRNGDDDDVHPEDEL
jgi:hypothetical protein